MNLFDVNPKVKSKLNVLPPNPEQDDPESAVGLGRFPSWLHRPMPKGKGLSETKLSVSAHRLHTVCEEAKCPNLLECWSKHTATFLIMGKACTRSCGFCDIDYSKKPPPLEEDEPERVAQSVKELQLNHVVITMVARDDLEDGGASQLKKVIERIRAINPGTSIEILSSDFMGNKEAWKTVLSIQPEIFNYNIETTRALTPKVRHTATYDRTLEFLNYLAEGEKESLIKSGFMVGLGETDEEVLQTMQDLKQAGVDIVTIGQYLQPNRHKLRVKRFVTPETFEKYKIEGEKMGLKYVYSGPFVRSSYNANLVIKQFTINST